MTQAVERLWSATTDEEVRAAVRSFASGPWHFADAYRALQQGRSYGPDAPTGRVLGQRRANSTDYPYYLQVPATYTPRTRYPVRVFLHGGVSRGPWNALQAGWWRAPERVASEEYIGVFPASWNEERWWRGSQLANLRGVLRELAAGYNIDENRVALVGVSDGGTGAYYAAFRDTTPWASFLPFIAHPGVLLNPRVGAEGEVFRTNLTNKPLYIVNGDRDRLYPTRSVDPFIADFSAAGVEMVYRPLEDVGHETSWWPAEAAAIDAFVAARPRDPHPVCISWETDSVENAGRAHWIRVDALGPTSSDAAFEASRLMGSDLPSGRVDAQRSGNEVRLRSDGVQALTVLLSPEVYDLDSPVLVWWNGQKVHDAAVRPDIDVLARWSARDGDRTMLYGAEVTLQAPPGASGQDLDRLPAVPGAAECRGTV